MTVSDGRIQITLLTKIDHVHFIKIKAHKFLFFCYLRKTHWIRKWKFFWSSSSLPMRCFQICRLGEEVSFHCGLERQCWRQPSKGSRCRRGLGESLVSCKSLFSFLSMTLYLCFVIALALQNGKSSDYPLLQPNCKVNVGRTCFLAGSIMQGRSS